MDSSEDNKMGHHFADELICWSTPEMKKNNSDNYRIDYLNNPFDKLEIKAANMDPFDLVHNQISPKNDPPCGNIISLTSEVNQLQKNVSTTDISITNIAVLGHIEHDNNTIFKDQLKDDSFKIYAHREINNISKENYVLHLDENKAVGKSQTFNLIVNPKQNETDVENILSYNEDKKNQIRKQTQQQIDIFIEKEKHENKNLENINSSLNISENIFNSRVMQINSKKNFNNFNKTSSNVNESIFPNQELINNSFDLNTLEPEWLEDDFIDFDESFSEVQRDKSLIIVEKSNYKMDNKLKIASVESKPNGLKTIQNKQNNGPLVTNIFLQQMMKPIAQSTPALNKTTLFKIPSSSELTNNSNNLLWQQDSNAIRSPMTTLNISRPYKENSNNVLNFVNEKKSKISPFTKSIRHSNTTVVLPNEVNIKNIENTKKTCQLNNSKFESKIYKIPKKMNMNSNRLSGLPIPKHSSILFKGKENMKP